MGKADCPAIPMSSGFSRFCLKTPTRDQCAIGIGKIPILTPVLTGGLNVLKTKLETNDGTSNLKTE